jgi:hypothetical protein
MRTPDVRAIAAADADTDDSEEPEMTFDNEFAEQITARFREGNPDDKYKRKPVVSRRELVAGLYEDIMAKRTAGYSVEGIAAYFGTLGAPIKVSTLKSYLVRCAHRLRPGQKVGGGQPRKRTRANTPGRLRSEQPGNGSGDAPTDGSEAQPNTTPIRGVDPAGDEGANSSQKICAEPSDDAAEDSVSAAPMQPPKVAVDVSATDSEVDDASTSKAPEANIGERVPQDTAGAPANEAPSVAPASEADKAAGDAVAVRRPSYNGIGKSAHTAGFGNIGFVPRR